MLRRDTCEKFSFIVGRRWNNRFILTHYGVQHGTKCSTAVLAVNVAHV